MIPNKIELTNFLPYKKTQILDFTGIHVACLVGDNGSGKSSLLEGMVWALWGNARDGKRSDDELIHYGETEMKVLLEFEISDQIYKIIRQRKIGKRSQLILALHIYDYSTESWRDLSEAGVKQTQKKIDNLLRIDYDTFMNSAFIAQGRADEFTVKSPANRKSVLSRILRLEQWDLYEEQARKFNSELKQNLSLLDRDIESYDKQLDDRATVDKELERATSKLDIIEKKLQLAEKAMGDVESSRQQLIHLNSTITDSTSRINQSEKELQDIEDDLKTSHSDIDQKKLVKQQHDIQVEIEGLQDLEKKIEDLSMRKDEKSKLSSRLKGENEIIKRDADALNDRINALGSEPNCPTCGQPLEEDAASHLSDEVEKKRGHYADNRDKYRKIDLDVVIIDDELLILQNHLKKRSDLENRFNEINLEIKNVAVMLENRASLEKRKSRWKENLAKENERLQSLYDEQKHCKRVIQESEEKQQNLDELRVEQRVWMEHVGRARQKIISLKDINERRKLSIVEREDIADKISIYNELVEAFGKKGVPAMIIEAAVPELENSANELLTRITYGKMNVRFDTQRMTKSGDVKETLDIKIADDLGTRNYEMYSGGESFRVNFAIRIALSKLLARRAGAQLQTIVIDEGFGTQDALGRQKLVEAIHSIQDDFERVLVITHIEELKDIFPDRINISKTIDGSTISVV